jgi:glutamate-5-semialdehyde dehydrogenase
VKVQAPGSRLQASGQKPEERASGLGLRASGQKPEEQASGFGLRASGQKPEIKLAALELAERAKVASRELARLDSRQRGQLVLDAAERIQERAGEIAAANEVDVARAAGQNAAFLDRLRLDAARIAGVARALREVAALPDPVGEVVESQTRPNGLRVDRVRAPLGVILMIYESRPNVTAEAAALCLRSGNAALLRGGSEALQTNAAILACFEGDLVQLVPPDRALLDELLQLEGQIDLCIPRGGPSLIRFIAERSRIPVIKHYQGVCHLYVAADADLEMATKLAVNGKTQRPGVCNALECVLIDQAIAADFLPRLRAAMPQVEFNQRYGEEFLDLKLAVATVDGPEAALAHIARYGSRHTESICTRDRALAERFIREVDASCVVWNASTRFNDGGELGLGAEIGISTSKLHAYGPMGLRELTCTRFVVRGEGQVRP